MSSLENGISTNMPLDVVDYVETINTISPIPKSKIERKRKTKVEGSSLLTGSPFKNHLLEQAARKVSGQLKISKSTQSKKKMKTEKRKSNSIKDPVLQGKEEKTSNKKLTCRLDKPRRQASAKVKSRGDINLQRSKYDSNHNTDAECIICGETFCSSKPHEQWIQCKKCKEWCHVECSGGETSTGFVCDFCC